MLMRGVTGVHCISPCCDVKCTLTTGSMFALSFLSTFCFTLVHLLHRAPGHNSGHPEPASGLRPKHPILTEASDYESVPL